MIHKKREHIEKVALCWNFFSGVCEFGDDFCWFSHRGQPKDSEHVECKICGQTFNRKCDLQRHIKQQHLMTVPVCRNSATKNVGMELKSAGFVMETLKNHAQNAINDNEEITFKIFDMMETFEAEGPWPTYSN